MATYLVLKRVKEDWVSVPGELLIDPPNAGILIARGYIIPVPDNYPGVVSMPSQTEAPAAPVEQALEDLPPADNPLPPEEDKDKVALPPSPEEDEDEEPKPEVKPKQTHKARPVARAARRR